MSNIESNNEGVVAVMVAVGDVRVVEGFNPRKRFDEDKVRRMTESVRLHGVLQPLLVRYGDDGGLDLVAGERRLRAAVAAGLADVPVIRREMSLRDAHELALVENLDREDLDVLEEGDGYFGLQELGFSVVEMSERFGCSRDYIGKRLEIRKLGDDVKGELVNGLISIKTAVALGRILDDEARGLAMKGILEPQYHSEPLAQDEALKLIKGKFLVPQDDARDWAERRVVMMDGFVGCEWMDYAESTKALGYGGRFADADKSPPSYDLNDRVRGDGAERAPLWGDFARVHGGTRWVARAADGGPVVLVDAVALKEADLALEDAGGAWFSRPRTSEEVEGGDLEAEREWEAVRRKDEEWVAARDEFLKDVMGQMVAGKKDVWGDLVRWLVVKEASQSDLLWDGLELVAGVEVAEERRWGGEELYAELVSGAFDRCPERLFFMLHFADLLRGMGRWERDEVWAAVRASGVDRGRYAALECEVVERVPEMVAEGVDLGDA